MNKKEVKAEIQQSLSRGESKSRVFHQFSGKGLSDRVIANLIASHASPELCDRHAKLIDAMIVISWLQLALGVLIGIGLVIDLSLTAGLIITGLIAGFCYLFVWGFTHNKAWAYHATILLSIVNLPKGLEDFGSSPISSLVGLTLGAGLIAFTWYVRSKLFPDFAFISPKKVKGQFVFSS